MESVNKHADMLSDEGKVFTDLILETFRLNGKLLAAGDKLTSGLPLSSARRQVLGEIIDGPFTVAQIARNMGLKRQSVQRIDTILAIHRFSLGIWESVSERTLFEILRHSQDELIRSLCER